MKQKTCPYAVCPGKERCALMDVLANPTSVDPKEDDRPSAVRMMTDCPNASELRKKFPQLYRRANT